MLLDWLWSDGPVVKSLDSQFQVPCSKPLGGSKVDSVFHLSEVDKMSTRNFCDLMAKCRLSPRSGSSFEAVELIHKKGL